MTAFHTLDDAQVAGQRVLVRVDLNVPMDQGRVSDATRLDRILPTLRELSSKGAKVILLAHFGRPKGVDASQSLAPIAGVLAGHLGQPVGFAGDCIGPLAKAAVDAMANGDVLCLENTRFHAGEEKNDPAFVKALADNGDLFVNDALSAAHRAHASTEGLAHVMPAFAGRTMQAEIEALSKALEKPDHPVLAVVGGAKVSTKLDLLGNLVSVKPTVQPAVISEYDITPVIDIYVSVHGRDFGGVVNAINKEVDAMLPNLKKGQKLTLRGQVNTMKTSYRGLLIGLAGAIVLVYLLIVVNFQSWIDPLIIVSALPAALAGIAWMLFITGTHLSVPALTGAIMTMGVATANSILLVSFALQRLRAGVPPLSAALEAGATRIRPVLMTAAAMIIGMVPMAIGFGEGAEQNAPLGRAVIGGLLFATVSTLFFVPIVFASVHRIIARRAQRATGIVKA